MTQVVSNKTGRKKIVKAIGENTEIKIIAKKFVDYIEINSQYFTGQFRPRYYWTNIPINPNTIPKKLNNETIKDILESEADEKYFLKDNISEKIIKDINKDKIHNGSIKKITTNT